MSRALERWNRLPLEEAAAEARAWCGSRGWSRCLAAGRPYDDPRSLLRAADRCWRDASDDDRGEAYAVHPRIGGRVSGTAAAEQSGVRGASAETLAALTRCNREYEERFGRVFLICAAGRTADEMLALCRERLQNDPRVEASIAAGEQGKITALRLERWLAS